MSTIPAPYFRITPDEVEQLRNWNFLDDYEKYRSELVAKARDVFIAVCHTLGQRPSQGHFFQTYSYVLWQSEVFRGKIAGNKLYLTANTYLGFAQLLTKYMIELDGAVITNVYC